MWKWYDAQIIDIQEQSPTTRLFRLYVAEPISFKAGQFITMDLPISDKRLKRWRSYSIANAPNAQNTEGGTELEFSIVKSEESTGGSRYLFEEAAIGTPIRFKGPDGSFSLRESSADKDLVFICTGTGVAPFRSIIWDMYKQKLPHKKVHLIFGGRKKHDILFADEFQFLEKNLSGFRFDAALSREPTWAGTKGYVHSIYTEGYKNVRSDVHFYICGWSKMIDEAVATLLLDLGYDKSQVFYELYG
ncbi:MAG: FAD-dependent oxidoreductase [Saprospiraceae bacterium]|nr:FAD-dependent oxidoreductase [Saprospiraceae bacterium]